MAKIEYCVKDHVAHKAKIFSLCPSEKIAEDKNLSDSSFPSTMKIQKRALHLVGARMNQSEVK